jgi:cytochrome c-type biogenesis protein
MEALFASFLLGIGTAASPCLLPLYPGFIAYLAGNRDAAASRTTPLLGLTVVLGVLTAVVAVGIVFSLLALPLSGLLEFIVPATTVLLVVLGVLLLAGRNPFARLASVQIPLVKNPAAQAYVYGLMLGPVALPCSGPFLVALLAISVGVVDATTRIGTFLVFGLGFGLPLILLSLIGAARGAVIARAIAARHDVVMRVAGVLLIVAAFAEPLRLMLEAQG